MAAAVVLCVGRAEAADATGKLVVDVQAFTTEVTLKPKVETQLKSGGLEWGLQDKQVIFTMVNKQFVNAEISHLTRYGTRTEIDVPAGDYTLTCVGLIPEGGLSPQKVLSKGGYFNTDVLHFTVRAGGTTTLETSPVIRKKNTFLLKFFIPELSVKVVEDGQTKDEKVVNVRDDHSTGWDDYSGTLKFVPK
jgi:hypothetical protein